MQDLLKTILPASIALIGTILVAIVGYRQWKRQQELARYGSFLSERQNAYKQLWEKLEAAHLYIRTEAFEKEVFQELMRAVNIHMITAGLLLKDGEKERVNRYLQALEALGQCLATADAGPAREDARDTMYATGALPPEVLQSVKGLQRAFAAVETERTNLIARFRKQLGAQFFD
jgi:hypothetical protein